MPWDDKPLFSIWHLSPQEREIWMITEPEGKDLLRSVSWSLCPEYAKGWECWSSFFSPPAQSMCEEGNNYFFNFHWIWETLRIGNLVDWIAMILDSSLHIVLCSTLGQSCSTFPLGRLCVHLLGRHFVFQVSVWHFFWRPNSKRSLLFPPPHLASHIHTHTCLHALPFPLKRIKSLHTKTHLVCCIPNMSADLGEASGTIVCVCVSFVGSCEPRLKRSHCLYVILLHLCSQLWGFYVRGGARDVKFPFHLVGGLCLGGFCS